MLGSGNTEAAGHYPLRLAKLVVSTMRRAEVLSAVGLPLDSEAPPVDSEDEGLDGFIGAISISCLVIRRSSYRPQSELVSKSQLLMRIATRSGLLALLRPMLR